MVQQVYFFKWDSKTESEDAKNLPIYLDSAAGFKVG